jgi:hypothetical protein
MTMLWAFRMTKLWAFRMTMLWDVQDDDVVGVTTLRTFRMVVLCEQ